MTSYLLVIERPEDWIETEEDGYFKHSLAVRYKYFAIFFFRIV